MVRLRPRLVVGVYDDEACGVEGDHFGPDGDDLWPVSLRRTDFAAVGRGYGFDAVTVRRAADLDGVASWVAGTGQAATRARQGHRQ